jgi:hypothetical protein
MIYDAEEDSAAVHRLANAIWNRGLIEETNNWEASMNAAALIYAARIQSEQVEILDDALRRELGDIHDLLSSGLKGKGG